MSHVWSPLEAGKIGKPKFIVQNCSRGDWNLSPDVWNYADSAGERTVDSHVAGLRRKLGDGVIRTARGVGYALEAEPRG